MQQDPPVLLTRDPELQLRPGKGMVTFIQKEERSTYSLRSASSLPKAREAAAESLEAFQALSQQFEEELKRWAAKRK